MGNARYIPLILLGAAVVSLIFAINSSYAQNEKYRAKLKGTTGKNSITSCDKFQDKR